jgi:ribosomal protein S18 acetylase RimI-like enzyme
VVFLVARDCGLARRLLASALARGLTVCRLETGEAQPEAMARYRRAGYREIEGFGVYAGMPLSRCFERRLEGCD